jgi:Fur family ferric uptake transcriptional regulator
MVIDNNFHLPITMKLTQNKITSLLRQHGYKITPQRRAVLNAIALSHDHLTPAAIYEKVHQQNPGVGLVTVYRTLDLLTELGLICAVRTEGNCRSYLMRRSSEHHHHLICSDCGTVADFAECDLNKLEQKLSRKTGFEINSHLLEFSGLCQNCRKRRNKDVK